MPSKYIGISDGQMSIELQANLEDARLVVNKLMGKKPLSSGNPRRHFCDEKTCWMFVI